MRIFWLLCLLTSDYIGLGQTHLSSDSSPTDSLTLKTMEYTKVVSMHQGNRLYGKVIKTQSDSQFWLSSFYWPSETDSNHYFLWKSILQGNNVLPFVSRIQKVNDSTLVVIDYLNLPAGKKATQSLVFMARSYLLFRKQGTFLNSQEIKPDLPSCTKRLSKTIKKKYEETQLKFTQDKNSTDHITDSWGTQMFEFLDWVVLGALSNDAESKRIFLEFDILFPNWIDGYRADSYYAYDELLRRCQIIK